MAIRDKASILADGAVLCSTTTSKHLLKSFTLSPSIMVYLNSALAAGVAISVLSSSVSALPASQAAIPPTEASASPTRQVMARRSPAAAPLAHMPTKRGSYVGGGYGSKRLRQAPLMKAERLAKVKRSLNA